MHELVRGEIESVMRATGYVTSGQAYDLSELVILLQKEGYARALEHAEAERKLRLSADN